MIFWDNPLFSDFWGKMNFFAAKTPNLSAYLLPSFFSSSRFSLAQSFALREMQLSISFIFPYSLMHSLLFCIQMFGYIVYTREATSVDVYTGVFLYECVNLVRFSKKNFRWFWKFDDNVFYKSSPPLI